MLHGALNFSRLIRVGTDGSPLRLQALWMEGARLSDGFGTGQASLCQSRAAALYGADKRPWLLAGPCSMLFGFPKLCPWLHLKYKP